MIGDHGENLAYLLGLPRSGTTLLCAMLQNHPQIACPPEPWLMLGLEAYGKTSHRHPADSSALGEATREFLSNGTAESAARAFARTAYNEKLTATGKSFLIDKTPRYYLILPYIRQVFPKARFIRLRRNPLAVAASFKTTWGYQIPGLLNTTQDNWAYYDFILGINRLLSFETEAGDSIHVVRYEELVVDPQPAMASLLAFLGLPPADGLDRLNLQKSEYARSYAGDKKVLATTAPHAQSLDTWEKTFTTEELQVLLDAIGAHTLRRLGYDGVVQQLLSRGVVDNGEAVTSGWLRRAENALAMRVSDIDSVASGWRISDRPTDDLPGAHGLRGDSPLASISIDRANGRAAEAEVRKLHEQLQGAGACATELRSRIDAVEQAHAATRQEASRAAQVAEAIAESLRGRAEDLETFQSETADRLARTEETLEARDAELAAARAATVAEQAKVTRLEGQLRWYRTPLLKRAKHVLLHLTKAAIISFPHGIRRKKGPLPKITVVTPVYNGETYIHETIESVLSQNYPNLEYIICDGGSTDGTMAVIDQYKDRITRVISERDAGMYDAVAKGLNLATGDVFGYLNSDDLFEPGGLMRVGEYFRDHPRSQVVYHEDTVTWNGWKFPNSTQPPFIDKLTMLKGHTMFQDGVFVRRGAYHAVGGVNREMRKAGDWDLWVRLAGWCGFHRAPQHVSSFRVRKGQITEDMSSYNAELRYSRNEWYKKMGWSGWLLAQPRHWIGRAYNLLWRRLKRRTLFFPLNRSGCVYGAVPPPLKTPEFITDRPICPLTGKRPDRLLFSSPDTRFGDPLINQVWYSSESDMALVYPPLTKEELNVLYEKHYSSPPKDLIMPPEGYASPYKRFFGGTLLDRLICNRLRLGRWATAFVRWDDTAPSELMENTPEFPRKGGEVSLLDVGCFEGRLLDTIKTQTDWKTFGLEPNSNAVAVARAKGHQVFQGYAEDAFYAIPEDQKFDIIFMGQTIEHLDDPLSVVRRLGTLLKPGGRLVMSTPNLRAKQIELYGPTWSHWHVPFHRYIFSKKSLKIMGEKAGFRLSRLRSYSHVYWTCMSVQLNRIGVAGAVSHAVPFDKRIEPVGMSLTAWSRFLWDWRGKGDYLVAVFKKA